MVKIHLEIHQDALDENDNVLIIDDLLATGGTIEATTKLIRRLGATVTDAAFVISLPDLGGENKLESYGPVSIFIVAICR